MSFTEKDIDIFCRASFVCIGPKKLYRRNTSQLEIDNLIVNKHWLQMRNFIVAPTMLSLCKLNGTQFFLKFFLEDAHEIITFPKKHAKITITQNYFFCIQSNCDYWFSEYCLHLWENKKREGKGQRGNTLFNLNVVRK